MQCRWKKHLTPESFALLFEVWIELKRKNEEIKLEGGGKGTFKVRFSFDGTHDVYRSSNSSNYEVLYFELLDVIHPQNEKKMLCLLLW